MSSHEAPTLVLDDPEQDQPDPADTTAVLPETQQPRPKLSDELASRLGGIVVADESGVVPFRETKREERWRRETPYNGWPFFKVLSPGHPHRNMINAVPQKVADAVDNREKGFQYGDHDQTVGSTAAAIRSLAVKLHGNEYQASEVVTYHGKVDHTGHIRSGYRTNQYRRVFAHIHQSLGRMRSPEHQVSDESKLALREIGKLHNVDYWMADADLADRSGRLADALRSSRPAQVRHTLKVLSEEGVVSERNPLHARWAEAMDPRNIKRFKQYIIESSDPNVHGETQKAAIKHISAVGIMGNMRPRAVADYLGVSFEEWNAQRYGIPTEKDPDAPRPETAVPKEVVDQICLLMKLDSRTVDYVEVPGGDPQPRTALDILIQYGAARPLTDPSHSTNIESPLSKSPMERVRDRAEARLEQEAQDREAAYLVMLSAQVGTDIEALAHRIAELNAESEEDADELSQLTRQRASIIKRIRSSGNPVPGILNGNGGRS
jgi:hypothetical protein